MKRPEYRGFVVGLLFAVVCHVPKGQPSTIYSCEDINTQACELLNSSLPNFCDDTKYSQSTCRRLCGNCPLTCYHCDTPIQSPGNCTTVQQCSKGEICLLKEMMAFDGHQEYIMTCEQEQICEGVGLGFGAIGKREAARLQSRDLSFSCCNSDLCNLPLGFGCNKDIVFVIDESGSVGQTNFGRVLNFTASIVSKLEIGPHNNQVAMETFASKVEGQWVLNTYISSRSLLKAIYKVPYHAGSTNTAGALEYTLTKVFTAAGGDRPSAPNVVIVVTDGRSANRMATIKAAQHLHSQNVDVIAVGIGNGVDLVEISGIASSPSNVIDLHKFDQLPEVVRNVTTLICS